jgi:hypothetical protein
MATNLILDSGAFSAWTKKKQIDLDAYADFALEYLDCFNYIVNLDVIPGEWKQKNMTPEMIEEASIEGWRNYKRLLRKGIPREKLIHVFHQKEDFKWLHKMMDEMDYIGLSPANDHTTDSKLYWLDDCMRHVTNRDGWPIIRFHGFGITSIRAIIRYPWYSVDSASWVLFSRYGTLLVPKDDDQFYSKPPFTIFVGQGSPERRQAGKHFEQFTPNYQKYILKYIESKGFTFEQVSEDHRQRDLLNLCFYLDLQSLRPEWPWPFRKLNHSLLHEDTRTTEFVKFPPERFYLYFAGNFPQMKDPKLERECRDFVLARHWEYNRLGSFYFRKDIQTLVDMKREELDEEGTGRGV